MEEKISEEAAAAVAAVAAKQPDQEESEKKKEEGKESEEESKEGSKQSPPLPQDIILHVYMHCEGCARKVRSCLKGFQGVEEVVTDCKNHKVIVKGENADPLKVLERVQRKSHRQVQLISPIPKPPVVEEENKPEEKEKPKADEKKEEPPQIVTVVLKVHMHCEACAQEIKKRILRMKGVEAAEADLKSSQVTVRGTIEPPKLVEYLHKRTGKHAQIVKQDPEKKDQKEESKEEEEKKSETEKKEDNKKEEEKKDGGDEEAKVVEEESAIEENINKVVAEMRKNEFNYYYNNYPPRYAMEMHAYPPQMFSDENPNACSVM